MKTYLSDYLGPGTLRVAEILSEVTDAQRARAGRGRAQEALRRSSREGVGV